MRRDVRGRVVLVTGASRGIGRRMAVQLAVQGAIVAVTARSVPELESLVRDLEAAGATVAAFPANLVNATEREQLIAAVVAKFGRLEVLINCAGVCSFGEFTGTTPAITRQIMEVNFFAAVELIRLAVPHLTKAWPAWNPAIVNVASIAGRCGIPSFAEHAASKHALVGMTESLRSEMQRFGIDVILVLPGVVRTDNPEKHFLRFEGKVNVDFAQGDDPETIATGVLHALQKNRTEKALGFVCWWVWFGKRIAPRFVRIILQRKVYKYRAQHPTPV
ncbi:MAG: SDR family NAD(P)-dependent oxidoreductase [Gemmataceae bacterium]